MLDTFVKKAPSDQKKPSDAKEEVKKEEAKVSYISDKQELILFMGSPGSGKSTFYHNYLQSYVRVSQDQLGTAAKCIKACQAALAEKKSVVIDNLNQTKEQRSRYIPLAQAAGVPIRLFFFDTPKDKCMHNNSQRATNTHRQHHSKKVSSVIIHTFFKNHEPASK
jgi:bifunctional polynucleotide phosphatase/kinase